MGKKVKYLMLVFTTKHKRSCSLKPKENLAYVKVKNISKNNTFPAPL